MKVIAFTKYDRAAASTRQRVTQYFPALASAGIEVDLRPLLPPGYVASLASGRRLPKRRLASAYAARVQDLITDADCDVLWIYSELFPFLPARFERLATRKNIPIVYDMDDAFFHQYDDSSNPLVRGLLGGKIGKLLSKVSVACCGNAYLRDYAARYCADTPIIPTVVDTTLWRPRDNAGQGDCPPVIGWIGSPSTWRYMRPLLPLLRELSAATGAVVHAVGAGREAEDDRFPGLTLIDWSEEGEIEAVRNMDIGLMPLPDDRWERGKCGYKLIQYMACGLPVVASPVGVNRDIVTPGANGYLADEPVQWRAALSELIASRGKRREMGAQGRSRVEADYSLASQEPLIVDAFRRAHASRER